MLPSRHAGLRLPPDGAAVNLICGEKRLRGGRKSLLSLSSPSIYGPVNRLSGVNRKGGIPRYPSVAGRNEEKVQPRVEAGELWAA